MNRVMKQAWIAIVSLVALAAPSKALAWEHLLHAWLPEDMPLEFLVASEKDCEETVPAEYCLEATQEAWDIWMSTPCVEFEAALFRCLSRAAKFIHDTVSSTTEHERETGACLHSWHIRPHGGM